MRPDAEILELLKREAAELGLAESALQKARDHVFEVSRWSRSINLTADREPEQLVIRHVLDSWVALPLLPDRGELADLGSGAGFPGIPIAIARPGLHVTLIESMGKKAAFLEHAARALGLRNVSVINDRVENLSDPCFDIACARALARPPRALEYCGSLLEKGKTAVLWLASKDLAAISTEGWTASDRIDYRLPTPGSRGRTILFLAKQ